LRAVVGDGHEVLLAVTRADKRRGRGGALVPSPVKAAAIELGIAVTEVVDDALSTTAELGVVVAFGRIIKPHVLAVLPMINVHFSLLPRWRGAAPVERAILAGDEVTGVCIMDVEEGLDTGGVYARAEVPIGPEETADELRARLVAVGTALLVETLRAGLGDPEPQQGEPTYADKIDPAELHLEWSRPAPHLHRVVRVGGAWTTFRDARLKVLRATTVDGDGEPGVIQDGKGVVVGTGAGLLELLEVQPEGRAPQPAAAWRNGARLAPGERLGS